MSKPTAYDALAAAAQWCVTAHGCPWLYETACPHPEWFGGRGCRAYANPQCWIDYFVMLAKRKGKK